MLAFITDLIVGLTLVRAQLRTSTNITIGTLPTFSTCQPALINWSGGSAPYRVYIYPNDWTNSTDWLLELPITTRASTTWNVILAAGSGIVVNVWDGVNDEYSEPSWIQDSGDSSCVAANGTYFPPASLEAPSSTSMLSVTRTPLSSRLPPIVVSVPQNSPSRVENIPATSVASSAAPPPATVTVIQGNGAGKMDGRAWILSTFFVGCFVFRAL